MKKEKITSTILIELLIIFLIIIIKLLNVFSILCILLKILIPLFIGLIYAWLINPINKKLSSKTNNKISSIIIFLSLLIIISLFLYFLLPSIIKESKELINIIPNILVKVESKLYEFGFDIKTIDSYTKKLLSLLPNKVIEILNIIYKYISTLIIGLILGLYISIDYENIINNIIEIIPYKNKCFITKISNKISNEVHKCINGTLKVATIVFIGDTILFYLIGLDTAFVLGLFCGITDLIPYIGPYIGSILAISIAFTKSKLAGILTSLACLIIQSLENYIFQPIIISRSIKVSPIAIMISLIICGSLLGIPGMLLASPLVTIIKVFIENKEEIIKECKTYRKS